MVLDLFSKRRRNVISSNQFTRETSSPIFSFRNDATIATGAFFLFDFHTQNSATEKYRAFNILTVTNNSSAEIELYPNQNQSQPIVMLSGQTRTLTQDEIGFVRSLLLKNTDSSNSITANQIIVQVKKDTLNTDSVIKSAFRMFNGERTGVF